MRIAIRHQSTHPLMDGWMDGILLTFMRIVHYLTSRQVFAVASNLHCYFFIISLRMRKSGGNYSVSEWTVS